MNNRRTKYAARCPVTFSVLGALYFSLGIISLLGAVAGWHFATLILWTPIIYGGINLLIAYGFFSLHRWLLPVLAFNWGANLLLFAVKFITHMSSSADLFMYGVAIVINSVILAVVYSMRKRLHDPPGSVYFGATVFALWLGMFCYNAIAMFT